MSKAPAVSRSKSTRHASGLGSMFGAAPPPPSRSKSHRMSATPRVQSRRPSVDQDAAMMSPPHTDTDAKASSKAARMMGMKTSRKSSHRDKTKSRSARDPYPLEDDLEPLDDDQVTPAERPEPSRRKSKRDSAQPVESFTAPPSADDPVLVDPMEVESPPAEAERPRRERERERPRRERGFSDATGAMGTMAGVAGTAAAVSGFKSMFGLGRKKAAAPVEDDRRDRRKTAYETEDERKRRKRSIARGGLTEEEEAKRLRHERRTVKRSSRMPEGDPDAMMSGANGTGNGSAEYDPEREARRAERRAKRDADKGIRRPEVEEAEAKLDRRRERNSVSASAENGGDTLAEKKARQMAELERRNKEAEEQLRRMAEKDDKRKSRTSRQAPTEDREHRSSRRKDKESGSSRPHTERRRSHAVDEEAERRRRHEERRAARRASEHPTPVDEPITDYFDQRNAEGGPVRSKHRSSRAAREEENQPYIHKGRDKTSSWVASLSEEPPLPPPISETVLDPPPGARETPDDEETPSQDEDIRLRIAGRRGPKRDKERAERRAERERERDSERDRKHSRRQSTMDAAVPRDEDRERRRESRRKSSAQGYAYEEPPPVRTWDGRPALDNGTGAKRGSWFKKIF